MGDTHITSRHFGGDTHITSDMCVASDMCVGVHISRGYTYHCDSGVQGPGPSLGGVFKITTTQRYSIKRFSVFTRFALNDAKEGEDLIFTGRLFFLQGDAMSGREEWEGQKPYCIWPLSGVQSVEAQRDKPK